MAPDVEKKKHTLMSIMSCSICTIHDTCVCLKSSRHVTERLCDSISCLSLSCAKCIANSFDDFRAPARGHNPLQIIPCGPNLPQKCDQLLCEFRELLRCPLEKNTMRGTCARRRVVMYRCASVVATVVRTPRSEVSERHRAGSWVWVVAKSLLEIW